MYFICFNRCYELATKSFAKVMKRLGFCVVAEGCRGSFCKF